MCEGPGQFNINQSRASAEPREERERERESRKQGRKEGRKEGRFEGKGKRVFTHRMNRVFLRGGGGWPRSVHGPYTTRRACSFRARVFATFFKRD